MELAEVLAILIVIDVGLFWTLISYSGPVGDDQNRPSLHEFLAFLLAVAVVSTAIVGFLYSRTVRLG